MKIFQLALSALLVGAAAALAGPGENAVAREAHIAFADHGGIWDWEVVDSSTILIQDRSRRWYKATLLINCIDLPFEQTVGFEANADGSFDKFSSIQTRQMRCPLSSLVRADAPVRKQKPKKADAASTPAPAATGIVKPLN